MASRDEPETLPTSTTTSTTSTSGGNEDGVAAPSASDEGSRKRVSERVRNAIKRDRSNTVGRADEEDEERKRGVWEAVLSFPQSIIGT